MKKTLLATAILASLAFSGSAFATPVTPVPYTSVAPTSSASGYVGSQSAAGATSFGNGSASTSTQSGSFVTFGQIGAYTGAALPAGAVTVVGGTANIAGFTSTAEYATSQSSSVGTGSAASNSWNDASAVVTSNVNAIGNNMTGYVGEASGASDSRTYANVATASANGGNTGAIQGSVAGNQGGYSASDSAIRSTSNVLVGSTWVPVTNIEAQTAAMAFNASNLVNTTVFGITPTPNNGVGVNVVGNSGHTAAVGN